MDAKLDERWKSAMAPFDGDCLYPNDYIPLAELRRIMIPIVEMLHRSYDSMPIYRFDDWHEHDGYVTKRSRTAWDEIEELLSDDDSLYAARHGDSYVHWAYYPEDCSFLFRFYLQR